MSLRASVTSALFFDNVRVPDSSRLPNVKGLKGPLGCLTQARYGITWGPIGAAIACFTEATEYAKQRILFKRPIAANQAVQLKLADMARRITLAQLLSLQLGRLKDAGKMQPTQVSLAKWNNCRMAIDIAREARDILGGAGITTEHCPIRHALNLESVITYEGTESVHQLVVGPRGDGHQRVLIRQDLLLSCHSKVPPSAFGTFPCAGEESEELKTGAFLRLRGRCGSRKGASGTGAFQHDGQFGSLMEVANIRVETERLILRLPRPRTSNAYAERSCADTTRAKYRRRPAGACGRLARVPAMPGAWAMQGFAMFSVIEKSSGRWVGQTRPVVPEGWPGTEVGWAFIRAAWGKGYATEGATRRSTGRSTNLGLDRSDPLHRAGESRHRRRVATPTRFDAVRGPGKLPPPFEDDADRYLGPDARGMAGAPQAEASIMITIHGYSPSGNCHKLRMLLGASGPH